MVQLVGEVLNGIDFPYFLRKEIMTQHEIIRQINHLLSDVKSFRESLNTGQLAEIRGKALEIADLCKSIEPEEVYRPAPLAPEDEGLE